MNELLNGSITLSYFVIALFFLKFWKSTSDRFFLLFAISFLIEAANRITLALIFDLYEASPIYFFIRFFSFCFIILAIFEKNKTRSRVTKSTDA